MCEIFLMYFACKSLGDMLRAKRRDPILFQIFLIVCWVGGELTGAVVGLVVAGGGAPGRQPSQEATVGAMLGALCGAGVGVTTVFVIAANLRARSLPRGRQSNFKFQLPGTAPDPAAAPSPFAAVPPVPPDARFQFRCPHGHLLEEAVSAAGQSRRCAYCHCFFTVPHPS